MHNYIRRRNGGFEVHGGEIPVAGLLFLFSLKRIRRSIYLIAAFLKAEANSSSDSVLVFISRRLPTGTIVVLAF